MQAYCPMFQERKQTITSAADRNRLEGTCLAEMLLDLQHLLESGKGRNVMINIPSSCARCTQQYSSVIIMV